MPRIFSDLDEASAFDLVETMDAKNRELNPLLMLIEILEERTSYQVGFGECPQGSEIQIYALDRISQELYDAMKSSPEMDALIAAIMPRSPEPPDFNRYPNLSDSLRRQLQAQYLTNLAANTDNEQLARRFREAADEVLGKRPTVHMCSECNQEHVVVLTPELELPIPYTIRREVTNAVIRHLVFRYVDYEE